MAVMMGSVSMKMVCRMMYVAVINLHRREEYIGGKGGQSSSTHHPGLASLKA